MQEEIANLVHPVMNATLRLRERLEQGESLDLDAEQARLKTLLLTEIESRRWIDYGGDSGGTAIAGSSVDLGAAEEESRPGGGAEFLGIRYALVCWIDELFILYSPAEKEWNERKLEGEVYGTNDRAWKFWKQAELALTRPRGDALEVFFLCVLMGFRGELREQQDELQTWISSTKTRIAKIKSQEWPVPLEYEPATYVPPHYGRDQLQHMIFAGGVVLLLMIPVVAFFLVHRLGH